MTTRTRLIGAAILCLAIAGSACGLWGPTPREGPPDPPPPPPPTARFTLSGTVTDATTAGNVPIEGVTIDAVACSPDGSSLIFTEVFTDGDGRYTLPGMCYGSIVMWVYKEGYRDKDETLPLCDGYPCYNVRILGDTRVDVELVRLSEPSASSLEPLLPSP